MSTSLAAKMNVEVYNDIYNAIKPCEVIEEVRRAKNSSCSIHVLLTFLAGVFCIAGGFVTIVPGAIVIKLASETGNLDEFRIVWLPSIICGPIGVLLAVLIYLASVRWKRRRLQKLYTQLVVEKMNHSLKQLVRTYTYRWTRTLELECVRVDDYNIRLVVEINRNYLCHHSQFDAANTQHATNQAEAAETDKTNATEMIQIRLPNGELVTAKVLDNGPAHQKQNHANDEGEGAQDAQPHVEQEGVAITHQ